MAAGRSLALRALPVGGVGWGVALAGPTPALLELQRAQWWPQSFSGEMQAAKLRWRLFLLEGQSAELRCRVSDARWPRRKRRSRLFLLPSPGAESGAQGSFLEPQAEIGRWRAFLLRSPSGDGEVPKQMNSRTQLDDLPVAEKALRLEPGALRLQQILLTIAAKRLARDADRFADEDDEPCA